MSLLLFATGTVGDLSFVSFGGIVRAIDPNDWSGSIEFILEVHGAASAGTFHAHLYDLTINEVVSGSELAISSVTKEHERSASFTLPFTARDYTVRFGGVEGEDYTCYDATLIVRPA